MTTSTKSCFSNWTHLSWKVQVVCLTYPGQCCMEGEGMGFLIYLSFKIHRMVQNDLRKDTQLLRGPRDVVHLE